MHAGFTTGLGLSYRHWTSDGFGIQLTALPVKTDSEQFVSLGLSGLMSVTNGRIVRSFVYIGNHVLWNGYGYNEKLKYNAGLGFGMEFGRCPKFNLMVGYGGYDITGDLWHVLTVEAGFYVDIDRRRTKK